MKKYYSLLGVLVLAGLSASAQTQAYLSTKQSAYAINDTTAVFTISYRFGFTDREVYLPVLTARSTSTTARDSIGFEITDRRKNTVPTGDATALVLSKATIKDGMYYVPKGSAADFTLMAVLHIPAGTTPEEYALHVTALPFVFVKDSVSSNQQLNPSELQYYATPKIALTPYTATPLISGATHTLRTDQK